MPDLQAFPVRDLMVAPLLFTPQISFSLDSGNKFALLDYFEVFRPIIGWRWNWHLRLPFMEVKGDLDEKV